MANGREVARPCASNDLRVLRDTIGEVRQAWSIDRTWHDRFIAELRNVDVVSFDVFDTALTRIVDSPVDVFGLLEHRLVVEFGTTARGFAQAREDAERAARSGAADSEDITLDAIYGALRKTLPKAAIWLEQARDAELQAERDLCFGTPDILAAYQAVKAAGKRIVFISDMYLPGAAITAMLKEAGFTDWDALLVSGETGRTKVTGRQWNIVAERFGPLERILHVGDDPWSDCTRPSQLGVRVLTYERASSERRVAGTLSSAVLPFSLASRRAELLRRSAPDPEEEALFWRGFGASFGALVVGTFLRWLAERAQRLGIEHLYFCARDGWLLQRAWDAARLGQQTGVKSSYLYVSRRPMNLAAGYIESKRRRLSLDLLEFLTAAYRGLPLRVMLERARLPLDGRVAAAVATAIGKLDTIVSSPTGTQRLAEVFAEHPDAIRESIRDVHESTIGYLTQEGLLSKRRIGLVDIGWHGTLQGSLRTLLRHCGSDTSVVGFYYGLWPAARSRRPVCGWMESLYGSDFIPLEEQPALANAVDMLEELHAAPHGTVTGFERKAGRWEPSLAHSPIESDQYARATTYFQDATVEVIREWFLHERGGPLRVDDLALASAISAMSAVCLSPSRRELTALGRLQHSANFDHALFVPLIPAGSRPATQDDMRRALHQAPWPVGTLRHWHDGSSGLDRECVRNLANDVLAALGERGLRQFA
jgi:HAD superfamily hydrolase (TIGR01549 family)